MPLDGANFDQSTQVLALAKHILETEGWIQGAMRNRFGRCSIGAITAAHHQMNMRSDDRAIYRLANAMGFGLPDGIPPWNDSHTKDEVLTAFDRAITGAV